MLINLNLSGSCLAFVAQGIHVTAVGRITHYYTHASVNLGVWLAKDADVCIGLYDSFFHAAVAWLLL